MNVSLWQALSVVVAVLVAVWVWNDASDLRARGAKMSPFLWAILSFFVCGLVLPAYLLLRTLVWKKQLTITDPLALDGIREAPEPDMTPDKSYTPWKEP